MPDLQLITLRQPKSPIAEAYRTLRTNIQFSSIDQNVQSIVVVNCKSCYTVQNVCLKINACLSRVENSCVLPCVERI